MVLLVALFAALTAVLFWATFDNTALRLFWWFPGYFLTLAFHQWWFFSIRLREKAALKRLHS